MPSPKTSAMVTMLAIVSMVATASEAATWTQTIEGRTGSRALATHPSDPNIVYLGVGNAVQRSSDRGASWLEVKRLGAGDRVLAIAVAASNPAVVYAVTGEGLLKSADDGSTWQTVSTPDFLGTAFAVHLQDERMAYTAPCCEDGIYRTADGGATWELVADGIPIQGKRFRSFAFDPNDPEIVYAAGNELYKSTDRGRSWSAVLNASAVMSIANGAVEEVVVDPQNSNRILAWVEDQLRGTPGGRIFVSEDGGQNWSSIEPSNLISHDVDDFVIHPGDASIMYATPSVFGELGTPYVYKSEDGGHNWQPEDTGLLADQFRLVDLSLSAQPPLTLFATTNSQGGLWALALPEEAAKCIRGDVDGNGRVSIRDALIVATYVADNSVTLPEGGDIDCGDVDANGRPTIRDALIIATYVADRTNPSLPPGIGLKPVPLALGELREGTRVRVLVEPQELTRAYRLQLDWNPASLSLLSWDREPTAHTQAPGSLVLVVVGVDGLHPLTVEFEATQTTHASLRKMIEAVAGDFSPHAVAVSVKVIPQTFALSGNYPNPFNPETTISYDLPRESAVSLKIYNAQGQTIRTLVQQSQTVGTYRVAWDGRDERGRAVGSGLYFYRLQAGDFRATQRMMLLK